MSVSVQDTAGNWQQLPDSLTGVQFSTSAPGGCDEATIPISTLPLLPEVQQGCRARIADGTTGDVLWTGRMSSPVVQRRGVIQSGDPSFEGQVGYLADRTVRYTPLVTRFDAWWPGSTWKPYVAGATVETTTTPWNPAVQALMVTMPDGYRVPGDCALASFHGFYDAGSDYSAQQVRAITFTHQESGVQSANRTKFQAYLWHGGDTVAWTSQPVPTATAVAKLVDPTVSADLTIGYQYNGAAVDTNSDGAAVRGAELWSMWRDIKVFRALFAVDGSLDASFNPLAAGGLYPHQIVTDLLGVFCAKIAADTARSAIDTTSDVLITSYDFSDVASMADILTDLNSLVPDHFWSVGPCDLSGRMPINWSAWDAAPTLLLPPGAVSYSESAGSDDLANWVTYAYTDANGQTAYARIQADPWDYPDILGIEQDAYTQVESEPLDLTGLASASAAQQVATAVLAEVATLPKSATATVTVPVADRASGAMLPPWALTAGCLAHVPETGETLRVTKCEVDVDSATATLTLGTPRRSTDQIVATMSKHRQKGS